MTHTSRIMHTRLYAILMFYFVLCYYAVIIIKIFLYEKKTIALSLYSLSTAKNLTSIVELKKCLNRNIQKFEFIRTHGVESRADSKYSLELIYVVKMIFCSSISRLRETNSNQMDCEWTENSEL